MVDILANCQLVRKQHIFSINCTSRYGPSIFIRRKHFSSLAPHRRAALRPVPRGRCPRLDFFLGVMTILVQFSHVLRQDQTSWWRKLDLVAVLGQRSRCMELQAPEVAIRESHEGFGFNAEAS